MVCNSCQKETAPALNFCQWCGAALRDQTASPFDDLKLTFLRVDLSGFTTMSEAMIAEDVMALLNEIFSVFAQIISANKGTIYQVIGDEIVSIFGLDLESGFAPHMAILTAEEMFNKLFDFNKKGSFKSPIGLKVGAEIEPASIFDLNQNVRNALILTKGFRKSQILQKNAASNTILVGENLYRVTKGFFAYREVGEFVEESLGVQAYEYQLKLRG
ncbi:adenylate/guanylate cyclase domain-containing protein [candidate division WOR-3 bacterium]|nr:adenylate/guanylate cyclase domain-containing protein [candidate division WOR-3 bacterium]